MWWMFISNSKNASSSSLKITEEAQEKEPEKKPKFQVYADYKNKEDQHLNVFDI